MQEKRLKKQKAIRISSRFIITASYEKSGIFTKKLPPMLKIRDPKRHL